jgi:hypothetical protein
MNQIASGKRNIGWLEIIASPAACCPLFVDAEGCWTMDATVSQVDDLDKVTKQRRKNVSFQPD